MIIESGYVIIKLNRQGELLWIKSLEFNPIARHIDAANNLYIAGIENINIYPNPANNFLNLRGKKLHSVSIKNLHGKTLMIINLHGMNMATLNLSFLKPGTNIIEVKNLKENETFLK